MTQNNFITAENSREWLASTGFIFPTDKVELTRYNLLFGDIDDSITGNEVDPFRIIRQNAKPVRYIGKKRYTSDLYEQKMVATNINKLPAHIMKLVKKSSDSQSGKQPE